MKTTALIWIGCLLLTLCACNHNPSIPVSEFLFTSHETCTTCHQNLEDESGNDVSIGTHWESTMMASAARDPYWQAAVRREILENPALSAVIQDKCATCHTPMAHFTRAAAVEQLALLDDGVLNPDHPLHELGIDGVSCNVCHQIEPDNLRQTDSFSGGYLINPSLTEGARRSYGPFEIHQDLSEQMSIVSGFMPVQSSHLGESALCAMCHTLFTPYVDNTGQIAGEFPEQTAFLEWQNSAYSSESSCQSCHMPLANGAVKIASTGGEPRSPFRNHEFKGGNNYIPALLNQYRNELGVTAPSSSFTATIARTEDLLSDSTASLEASAERNDTELIVTLKVMSTTGHKYPTGFPSRRAWLHVQITDNASRVIFESGAPQPDGSIAGNDNDADATLYEPHYTEITTGDQVQIYEPILHDVNGEVTTILLRGSGYLKDNRILPKGFSASYDDSVIGVRGAAAVDTDFAAGSHRLRYRIPLASETGTVRITARLLHQVVAYRWAQSLTELNTSETDRFSRYYRETPNAPIEVATTTIMY